MDRKALCHIMYTGLAFFTRSHYEIGCDSDEKVVYIYFFCGVVVGGVSPST